MADVWSCDDQRFIDAYLEYLNKMTEVVQQLRRNGPDGLILPAMPKRDIEDLFGHDECTHWTYADVEKWAEQCKACKGDGQSPVNIVINDIVRDYSLTPFKFTNFDRTSDIRTTIQNDGHTVRVDYKSGDLRVSDGGLQDEYSVAQYHFHWGSVDTQGSEHTVDCKAYPMEMHVVTFNRKYGDLERAMKREDGLAALGIFFEISSKDNPDFQPIIEALAKINRPGIVIELAPVPLRDLLPADTGRYYRYPGSITTPPCREVVTWTVFSEPVRISAKQMKAFRSLWFEDRMPDGYNNFRPVQPLNRDRIIRASFTPADETNS